MVYLSKGLVKNRVPTCIQGDIFPSPYMKHKGIPPPQYLSWELGQSSKAKYLNLWGLLLDCVYPKFLTLRVVAMLTLQYSYSLGLSVTV